MTAVNGYETVAKTSTYAVVKINNTYRIENRKGPFQKSVPYVEIPKDLADEFLDMLLNPKAYDQTMKELRAEFNSRCTTMIEDEDTENYYNDLDEL